MEKLKSSWPLFGGAGLLGLILWWSASPSSEKVPQPPSPSVQSSSRPFNKNRDDFFNSRQEISAKPRSPLSAPKVETMEESTTQAITEIDSIDLDDPNASLALMASAMTEELDADRLYDYFQSLGWRGFPALGALAGRLSEKDPDRARAIVDSLLDSVNQSQQESESMLIAEALSHVKGVDFNDRLYEMIHDQADERTRYKLYGTLSGKELSPEAREKFREMALQDTSPDIKEVGLHWEHMIETRPTDE